MQGKQIKTMKQLIAAWSDKRAVTVPGTVWKRTPAAIVIHLPAIQVLQLLERGIFLYEKKKSRKHFARR